MKHKAASRENSDDELLNPNAEPIYDKKHWVKCQFKKTIKRVYQPPKTLKEFIELVKRRFHDLDEEVVRQSLIINGSEAPMGAAKKKLVLVYYDSDNDENEIEEDSDLLTAYTYAQKRKSKKVIKILVKHQDVRSRKISLLSDKERQSLPSQYVDNSNPFKNQVQQNDQFSSAPLAQQQQLVENASHQSQSLFVRLLQEEKQLNSNQQEQQPFEQYFDNADKPQFKYSLYESNSLKQKADDALEEFKNRASLDYDNEEQAQQYLLLKQYQKQQEELKKQEEADEKLAKDMEFHEKLRNEMSYANQGKDQKPSVGPAHQNNQQPPQNPYPELNYQKSNEKEYNHDQPDLNLSLDRSLSQRNNIFNKVIQNVPQLQGFLKCQKINVNNQQRKPIKSFFEQNYQAIVDKISSAKGNNTQQEQMAKAIDSKEAFAIAKPIPNSQFQFEWQIQNCSKRALKKGSKMVNILRDYAQIRDIAIPDELKPGEAMLLTMRIQLPGNIDQNIDKIILQFKFVDQKNQPFGDILVGIVDFNPNFSIEESMAVDQLYKENNVHNDDLTMEDNIYFQASELCDKGFGDFNRCCQILMAYKGDVEQAKNVLSKLIFKQGKGE